MITLGLDLALIRISCGSLINSTAMPARLAGSVIFTGKNRSLTTARTFLCCCGIRMCELFVLEIKQGGTLNRTCFGRRVQPAWAPWCTIAHARHAVVLSFNRYIFSLTGQHHEESAEIGSRERMHMLPRLGCAGWFLQRLAPTLGPGQGRSTAPDDASGHRPPQTRTGVPHRFPGGANDDWRRPGQPRQRQRPRADPV